MSIQFRQYKKFVFIILLLIVACNKNQIDKNNIKGYWKVVDSEEPFLYGVGCVFYDFNDDPIRFIFKNDSVINYLPGFESKQQKFLGNLTEYKLEQEKLEIFNLTTEKWDQYSIKYVSNFSLVLEKDTNEIILSAYNPDTTKKQVIDQVHVSVNSNYSNPHRCPSYNIILASDSIVITKNNVDTTLYSKTLANKIITEFEQINLTALYNQYNDPFLEVNHLRHANFLFIHNSDTIKEIKSYLPFTPYNLKNKLIDIDEIVMQTIINPQTSAE